MSVFDGSGGVEMLLVAVQTSGAWGSRTRPTANNLISRIAISTTFAQQRLTGLKSQFATSRRRRECQRISFYLHLICQLGLEQTARIVAPYVETPFGNH